MYTWLRDNQCKQSYISYMALETDSLGQVHTLSKDLNLPIQQRIGCSWN